MLIKLTYKQLYINQNKRIENLQKSLDKKDIEINKLKEELDTVRKKNLSNTNSKTAKNGYKEEDMVCDDLSINELRNKFSSILGNEYDACSRVVGNHKCDIQSNNKKLTGQVKKYRKGQFQQLDRHWIDHFIKSIPELIGASRILKDLFEYPLLDNETHVDKSTPLKKLCLSNYSHETITNFLLLFNNNKRLILNYAFIGTNSEIHTEYLFGVEYLNDKRINIILFVITEIINYLETLDFKISPKKTAIILGDGIISLQRKGGDNGKKCSNQLQFKIIISKLIDKVEHIQYNYNL